MPPKGTIRKCSKKTRTPRTERTLAPGKLPCQTAWTDPRLLHRAAGVRRTNGDGTPHGIQLGLGLGRCVKGLPPSGARPIGRWVSSFSPRWRSIAFLHRRLVASPEAVPGKLGSRLRGAQRALCARVAHESLPALRPVDLGIRSDDRPCPDDAVGKVASHGHEGSMEHWRLGRGLRAAAGWRWSGGRNGHDHPIGQRAQHRWTWAHLLDHRVLGTVSWTSAAQSLRGRARLAQRL
jgi:hypothetical protein